MDTTAETSDQWFFHSHSIPASGATAPLWCESETSPVSEAVNSKLHSPIGKNEVAVVTDSEKCKGAGTRSNWCMDGQLLYPPLQTY